MSYAIVPYTRAHAPAVHAFNERLRAAGATFRLPASSEPEFPRRAGATTYQEYYLAVEDDATVRGGYILRHQPFRLAGETVQVAHYRLPLSEGIVDRKYAAVGLSLLSDALARQPLLYALGMGGADRPLPKLLRTMKWEVHTIPFSFRVLRAGSFLRNIRYLRTSRTRTTALDAAAYTGVGWLGMKLWQGGLDLPRNVHVDPVAEFGAWTDRIWRESRDHFALCGLRDQGLLDALYPPEDDRIVRLRVSADGHPVGWAVCLATRLARHKQFGEAYLGSIADCLAIPGMERHTLGGAVGWLTDASVDLIVSNQCHHAYIEALDRIGFKRGPSNFALAISPALGERLQRTQQTVSLCHFNRGDGDGLINL